MADPNFINKFINYDIEKMPTEIVNELKKYMAAHPDF